MSEETQSFEKSKLRSIVGMVLLLVMLMTTLKLINIRSVDCYTDGEKLDENVCSYFSSLYGSSLFFTDFYNVNNIKELDITQSDDSYYLDRIEKKLPGTLIIHLVNEPSIYRYIMDGNESYLVNRKGKVKIDDSSLDFPKIKGFYSLEDLNDTQQLPQSMHYYLVDLVESLQKDNVPFTSLEYQDDETIIIYLPDSLLAITSLDSNPREESKRLSLIVDELNRIDKEIVVNEIDLRFNYPILR